MDTITGLEIYSKAEQQDLLLSISYFWKSKMKAYFESQYFVVHYIATKWETAHLNAQNLKHLWQEFTEHSA